MNNLTAATLPALAVAMVVAAATSLDAQRAPRWTFVDRGSFESRTFPSMTATDFGFARKEADAMAGRWMPTAKLFKVDFRLAPPMAGAASGGHGMLEAYFYYLTPTTNPAWSGLRVSAGIQYGNAPFYVSGTRFDGGAPIPTAAPATLADPIEGLRRLKVTAEDFAKAGIHLKAAGSPPTTAINFGLTNGMFEQYLDRTLPGGQYVWWTEVHSGTGNNTFVYLDASSGQGTVLSQLR